jgi:hypothetical protein
VFTYLKKAYLIFDLHASHYYNKSATVDANNGVGRPTLLLHIQPILTNRAMYTIARVEASRSGYLVELPLSLTQHGHYFTSVPTEYIVLLTLI